MTLAYYLQQFKICITIAKKVDVVFADQPMIQDAIIHNTTKLMTLEDWDNLPPDEKDEICNKANE